MDRIARDYWLAQKLEGDPVLAVNPGRKSAWIHGWTRRMLQRWTLERLRALGPRFRRCVDLGCGYGDWTELFASIADEVHGCELVPAFADQARARVPGARIDCCDLRSYALPGDADLIYIGAVLLYLREPDVLDLLRRVRDAAAPGAVIAWREYGTFNFGRRTINLSEDRFSIHRSTAELRWLAELAGLEVIEERSAYSIYGEMLGGRALQWPLRALMRAVTLPCVRASHTLVLRSP